MNHAPKHVATPLIATLLAQVVTAAGLFTIAVLAERIAPELGIPKALVGYYVALVFFGAGVISFFSGGPVARYGPVRAIQIGILVMAPAILLANTGRVWVLPVSALLLGLGYGPFTPAASQILADATGPRWRALVFSVKQAGAPMGAMCAGLAFPMIEKPYGWRAAVIVSVALLLLSALLLQGVRAGLDTKRSGSESLAPRRSAQALRELLADRELRRLTIASFVFAMMQMSLFSLVIVYLIADYLVDAGDNDLILAGGIYSTMQVGGLFSRIVWGWVADRFDNPRTLLALLGLSGGVATLGVAAIHPGWSLASVHAICLVAGITASGWNGLYLAELSRNTPPEQVGDTIGTAMLFTYTGLVVGSTLCTTLVLVSDSYQTAFTIMGSLSVIAALWVLLGRVRAASAADAPS